MTKVLSITMMVIVGLFAALPALGLTALDEWNPEARDALKTHVMVWLSLMMLNNIASIAFVKNYVAARWVFAGFIVSHTIVMIMWAQDVVVLAGQVSLFHIIFWTPGVFAILIRRHELKRGIAYRIWATLALIFYFGSMTVDFRDAAIYLNHLLG